MSYSSGFIEMLDHSLSDEFSNIIQEVSHSFGVDRCWGWAEGSLLNSYYTEVYEEVPVV